MPQPFLHSPLGTPFIELQSVDSTNNYALTMVHAGLAQAGTAIFAHHQSAGKGQRGKTWGSEKSKSLSLSIIMDPAPLDTTRQFWLSACVALAVCRVATELTQQPFKIKWPNDLYWHDRKAGGILIESIIRPEPEGVAAWKTAIVGIGININQSDFPPDLGNPVSLLQITGRNTLIVDFARELCARIDESFTKMIANGFPETFKEFNSVLYKNGETVRLKKDNRSFEATLLGVSETGELIVKHGIEQRYAVGEVQLVPGGSVKM